MEIGPIAVSNAPSSVVRRSLIRAGPAGAALTDVISFRLRCRRRVAGLEVGIEQGQGLLQSRALLIAHALGAFGEDLVEFPADCDDHAARCRSQVDALCPAVGGALLSLDQTERLQLVQIGA